MLSVVVVAALLLKSPRITLMIEWFMFLHMMYDRIVFEESTSAPTMISKLFCSVKLMLVVVYLE